MSLHLGKMNFGVFFQLSNKLNKISQILSRLISKRNVPRQKWSSYIAVHYLFPSHGIDVVSTRFVNEIGQDEKQNIVFKFPVLCDDSSLRHN